MAKKYVMFEDPPRNAPDELWIDYYNRLIEARDAGEELVGAMQGVHSVETELALAESILRSRGLEKYLEASSASAG